MQMFNTALLHTLLQQCWHREATFAIPARMDVEQTHEAHQKESVFEAVGQGGTRFLPVT